MKKKELEKVWEFHRFDISVCKLQVISRPAEQAFRRYNIIKREESLATSADWMRKYVVGLLFLITEVMTLVYFLKFY